MTSGFDLSLSPTVRRSAPSKGRRANQPFGDGDDDKDETLGFTSSPLNSRPISGELFLDEDGSSQRGSRPPPHGRRTGGWADEASRAKTAKSVRMVPNAKGGGIGSDDEEDGSIPVIPDLDDVRDEDMAFTVAEAPSVTVNRVATYKELDNDLLKHVAFATLDDVDLKLLTRRMAPENALKEHDEPWPWDVIFAEVKGELQKEWSAEDQEEEEHESGSIEQVGPNKNRPYTAFNRFPV